MALDSGAPIIPVTQPQDAQAPNIANNPSQDTAPDLGQNAVQPVGPDANQVQNPNATVGQDERKGSGIGGALADVFQTIAGGKKTIYNQTENGPVPVEVNLQPGEIARHILASALVGLAGGLKAKGQPGNAGANAAAAGFEANQERVDKEKQQAKEDAQKTFTNKQIADEATLRKAANARDQQRSIQEAQEHAIHMDQARQQIEQGKTEFAQQTIEFDQRQADKMNLLVQLGGKPLTYPDGKPVEEFNSPQEAADWAHKNSKLAIQPGKYNTLFSVDPNTGRYVIMQKPLGWDDPQWLGMKLGSDGQPERDKNGNMVPDGSFRDMSGKVVVPTSQMSPKQMYDSQTRLLDLENKKLTREESLERIRSMRMANSKDAQQNRADAEFNKANGDPNATDPKTGQFIVSPASRTILQQRFIKEAALQDSIMKQSSKDLETATDKDEIAQIKQDQENARQNLRQLQLNMSMLGNTDVSTVTANNIKKQFTRPDGSYDVEGAVKAVDALQGGSGLKQAIRQKVSGTQPDTLSSPETFGRAQQHVGDLFKAGKSVDDVVAEINKTGAFSQNDKTRLIAVARQGGGSKNVDLSSVSPDNTLVQSAQGTQIIPNGSVAAFIKSNPGYKVVGQGTQQASSPDFGSR